MPFALGRLQPILCILTRRVRYRYCATFALKGGLLGMAKFYAKYELLLERGLLGSETGHLRHNMEGAEYWLANLEGEWCDSQIAHWRQKW